MSQHHFGNLLKRSSIATFSHKQTYTSRNVIEDACGRIGKHISPLKHARIIALDSDYGIPIMKNNDLKVSQLKVFQESFNFRPEIEPPTKRPSWEVLHNPKPEDSINISKLSEAQFKTLKSFISLAGKNSPDRKNATLKELDNLVKFDDSFSTPVNLPILNESKSNEVDIRVTGKGGVAVYTASGFVVQLKKNPGLIKGKVTKGKTVGLSVSEKGFIPIVEIEGEDIGKQLSQGHSRKPVGFKFDIGNMMSKNSKSSPAGIFAAKFREENKD